MDRCSEVNFPARTSNVLVGSTRFGKRRMTYVSLARARHDCAQSSLAAAETEFETFAHEWGPLYPESDRPRNCRSRALETCLTW